MDVNVWDEFEFRFEFVICIVYGIDYVKRFNGLFLVIFIVVIEGYLDDMLSLNMLGKVVLMKLMVKMLKI